ncbi:hypothetical protein [Enterorhabdus sp. P55]|uniref:hypothetical protein n=1 Tax=Enterorhabdus sp. P55 TaxID=2304571 RepID=UPI0013713613|nr:hypothetical protein [Enterorhabdus sp. P55]NBI33398.1 hypothetical protein [Enterorhabdus sp. P55]NCE77027.1 hypothetical protein [Anaerotruncus sp. X29]
MELYVQLKDNAITNVIDDTYAENISSDYTDFGDMVYLDLNFTFEQGKDFWMRDNDGPTAFQVSAWIINHLNQLKEMTREQFINVMEAKLKSGDWE